MVVGSVFAPSRLRLSIGGLITIGFTFLGITVGSGPFIWPLLSDGSGIFTLLTFLITCPNTFFVAGDVTDDRGVGSNLKYSINPGCLWVSICG